jgi:hypothetical protein
MSGQGHLGVSSDRSHIGNCEQATTFAYSSYSRMIGFILKQPKFNREPNKLDLFAFMLHPLNHERDDSQTVRSHSLLRLIGC